MTPKSQRYEKGSGGGQVVNVLTIFCDNASLSPAVFPRKTGLRLTHSNDT